MLFIEMAACDKYHTPIIQTYDSKISYVWIELCPRPLTFFWSKNSKHLSLSQNASFIAETWVKLYPVG